MHRNTTARMPTEAEVAERIRSLVAYEMARRVVDRGPSSVRAYLRGLGNTATKTRRPSPAPLPGHILKAPAGDQPWRL